MRPEQGRALLAKCLVQRFLRVARLRCAEAGNFVLFYRRLRFFGPRAMCLYRRQASFFARFFPVCHSERGDESFLCRLLSASHVLARPLFVILSGAKKLSSSPELRQVSGKSRATLPHSLGPACRTQNRPISSLPRAVSRICIRSFGIPEKSVNFAGLLRARGIVNYIIIYGRALRSRFREGL